MVGVNEVGICWKYNVLIRGGLTDVMNIFYESHVIPAFVFTFHGLFLSPSIASCTVLTPNRFVKAVF